MNPLSLPDSIGGLHDYGNYDSFLPNFAMAYKTIQRVSVSNLKLSGPTKTELRGKRSARISCYVIWENGLGTFSCPPSWLPEYKCMEIFKTLNIRNFCIYWCIDLKPAEIFQNRAIYIVLKFCPKDR